MREAGENEGLTIPLADVADRWLALLAAVGGSAAIAAIDGATLLGERAMLRGLRVSLRRSAGGGCRLYDACDGTIALNLARPEDRALLPALFETEPFNEGDDNAIAHRVATRKTATLIERGRMLGLAVAAVDEPEPAMEAVEYLARARSRPEACRSRPRVLDLSALWAGPLAGHLLALAGAEVVKIESPRRPDRMRDGDALLYTLLNQGKAALSIDLTAPAGRDRLLALVGRADIVIEAARPRGLAQLGIDAEALVAAQPGLVWLTITGHGARGAAGGWVGFGDDCAIAAGLSTALSRQGARPGFVGDAIGDPLSGIRAALVAWDAWRSGRGGRIGVAMRAVVAEALAEARARDAAALRALLAGWSCAEGQPFPTVGRRTPLSATGVPDWAVPC